MGGFGVAAKRYGFWLILLVGNSDFILKMYTKNYIALWGGGGVGT